MHGMPIFLRLAAPLRFAARRKGTGVYRLPVGFARAKGARFTHGYILAAASRLTLLNSYECCKASFL